MNGNRISNITRILVMPDMAALCAGVGVVVSEMYAMTGGGTEAEGRHRRRSRSHMRQIAMYLCHVILQIPMSDIAEAFGCDRSTVGHACKVIEDRRDDRSYDAFVSSIERIIEAILGLRRPANGCW